MELSQAYLSTLLLGLRPLSLILILGIATSSCALPLGRIWIMAVGAALSNPAVPTVHEHFRALGPRSAPGRVDCLALRSMS